MSFHRVALTLTVLVAAYAPTVQAASCIEGLAVAASPDGSRVVAVGENRTLYVLDAATLAVKQRVPLNTSVGRIAFTPDGSSLLVLDSEDTLTWYSTKEWKPTGLSVALSHPVIPRHSRYLYGVNRSAHPVTVEVATAKSQEVAKDFPCYAVGTTAKGDILFVWGDRVRDAGEVTQNMPAQVTEEERFLHEQHHDGWATPFRFVDMKTGRTLSEGKTWLSAFAHGMTVVDGSAVLLSQGWSITIDQKGATTVRKLGTSIGYGHGFRGDYGLFAGGNLGCFTIGRPPTFVGESFKLDRLPGYPEYVQSCSITDAGDVFLATGQFRVIKATEAGKIVAAAAVY